ncbi:MAG: hypothetical protein ACE5IO_07000 [Thermoplasmata archaeon]
MSDSSLEGCILFDDPTAFETSSFTNKGDVREGWLSLERAIRVNAVQQGEGLNLRSEEQIEKIVKRAKLWYRILRGVSICLVVAIAPLIIL